MVAALRAEPRTEAIVLSDFTATELSPGVFLVRYETVIHGARTHRTSIWLRSDQHLRLRFHQGTPAATDA